MDGWENDFARLVSMSERTFEHRGETCDVRLRNINGIDVIVKRPYMRDDYPDWFIEYTTNNLEKEAKIHAILTDMGIPGIPRYLSYSKTSASPHGELVMEYIEGQCLEDFLRQNPSLAMVKSVIRQICVVLTSLQERMPGFRHADLHCDNIIVTATGSINIIDFGNAGTLAADGLIPTLSEVVSTQFREIASDLLHCVRGMYYHIPDHVWLVTFLQQLTEQCKSFATMEEVQHLISP